MTKKCMICSKPAVYKIKDTTDYYCEDCAEENFTDLSVLVKVEEEAQRLKKFVEEKITGKDEEDEEGEEDKEEREEKKDERD